MARLRGAEWVYWNPAVEGIVELGTVQGFEVALPAHFHAEHQLTFVLAGRRRFLLGREVLSIEAGHAQFVPAGVAHESFPEPAGVTCLNAYLPKGEYAVAAMLRDVEHVWRKACQLRADELDEIARGHRQDARADTPMSDLSVTRCTSDCRETVGEMAARAGMSREGFTRMFARQRGAPPHAFGLMTRLNTARGLLRAGENIAAVAAETGFADQSHFGRWFRRAFGVTPGNYRRCWQPPSWPRSQTFQTQP